MGPAAVETAVVVMMQAPWEWANVGVWQRSRYHPTACMGSFGGKGGTDALAVLARRVRAVRGGGRRGTGGRLVAGAEQRAGPGGPGSPGSDGEGQPSGGPDRRPAPVAAGELLLPGPRAPAAGRALAVRGQHALRELCPRGPRPGPGNGPGTPGRGPPMPGDRPAHPAELAAGRAVRDMRPPARQAGTHRGVP